MRLPWLVPLLLAGCAAGPPMDEASVRARAPHISNFQLCGATMYGPPMHAGIAREELQRRGFDCTPLIPAIVQANQNMQTNAAAQQRAQADAAADLSRIFSPPVSPTVTCRTVPMPGSLQTTCR